MVDVTTEEDYLFRVDLSGARLVDTWSNCSREHQWIWGPVLCEDDVPPEWARCDIRCARCSQTRRVFHRIDPDGVRWGCADVPWTYRISLWWNKRELPAWDVNTRPPWLTGR